MQRFTCCFVQTDGKRGNCLAAVSCASDLMKDQARQKNFRLGMHNTPVPDNACAAASACPSDSYVAFQGSHVGPAQIRHHSRG